MSAEFSANVLRQSYPPGILESLQDRDRICPAPAGQGWIQGNRLRMHLPAGDLDIRAPRHLLTRVFEHCDGMTTWNDVVAAAPARRRIQLSAFLEFLFEQGALVDSIHLTLITSALASQPTPIGMGASTQLTDEIGRRFSTCAPIVATGPHAQFAVPETSLDGCLAQRISTYTFSGDAPTQSALMACLWSLAGTVADTHPRAGSAYQHRTIGSGGGMYLVRWLLVLRQSVGELAPGVYTVSYPRAKTVALVLVSSDVSLFYRAFLQPWQLTFATGAVIALADGAVGALRYRNRALQYLFLEAGASLQNLALMAPEHGVSCSTIGGYCDETVRRMCGLTDEALLASAIFGGCPSCDQAARIQKMPAIDFVWGNSKTDAYDLPLHIARARVRGRDTKEFNTWGKDADPWLAYVKAHAETIERQGMREPKNITVSAMCDLPGAIHPASICTYAESQFESPGFPYARFDEKRLARWVRANDAVTGATLQVPADFVYGRSVFGADLSQQDLIGVCLQANSSGCAAHSSPERAQLAALLEAIERDAFMRHWLTQIPGTALSVDQLPDNLRVRLAALQAAGCRVSIQSLDAVAASVCLAAATHDHRTFTCVSACARFDFYEAAAGALDELETSVFTHLVGQDFSPLLPQEVTDPETHALLYSQADYYRYAEHLLHPAASMKAPMPVSGTATLESLVNVLVDRRLHPSFVDLTPAAHCLDQGRTPLTVVKAVVPGLIPISFGYGREPRAMVAKCDRRSFMPHPFP